MVDLRNQKTLKEVAALAEDNNRMLKKIRRGMMWARIFRIIYWVVIIGLALGFFYFLQPYIEELQTLYGNIRETTQDIGGIIPEFGGSAAGEVVTDIPAKDTATGTEE